MFVPPLNSTVMLKSAFHSLYFPFSILVPYQCHSSLQVFLRTLQAFIALSFGVTLISKSAVCNLFLGKPLWVPFLGSEVQKAVQ